MHPVATKVRLPEQRNLPKNLKIEDVHHFIDPSSLLCRTVPKKERRHETPRLIFQNVEATLWKYCYVAMLAIWFQSLDDVKLSGDLD